MKTYIVETETGLKTAPKFEKLKIQAKSKQELVKALKDNAPTMVFKKGYNSSHLTETEKEPTHFLDFSNGLIGWITPIEFKSNLSL